MNKYIKLKLTNDTSFINKSKNIEIEKGRAVKNKQY